MMKRFMMMGIILAASHFAFSQQRVANDPGYSVNNYKHPNKAAYAKKHSLDKSTTLEVASVNRSDNYKQPYSTNTKKQFAIAQSQNKKRGGSYKHPYGL